MFVTLLLYFGPDQNITEHRAHAHYPTRPNVHYE